MKRHLPLAAMIVLAFASFCFAQPQATASPSPAAKPRAPRVTKAQLQKQISEMETKMWQAWKDKDVRPFETNLTSDAILLDASGVSTKSQIPEGIKSCQIQSFSLSDWKLTKVSSTTAIITYKATQSGTCGGQAIPGSVWASSVWVKRKGGWVSDFHQETPAM